MNGSQKRYRAGRYVNQLEGYRSFIPNPLPPVPPVKIDESLQVLLSQADRALGRLDGSIQTLPNADWFVYMYVRKEAVLSSQIEGTQSSLQDLLSAEAKLPNPDVPHDVSEVVNYVEAMNHGLKRLTDLPVAVRLIKEIHERLLAGTRGSHLEPGELRRSQNWIGPSGCTLKEAVFVPPPPGELFDHLHQLEQFIHSDSKLPLLVKIGLVHAQFETIHPFLDGNGRVGRLLITFLLCQQKVLIKPVLYLSYFFKKHRTEYYELLQATRDRGEWEEWLEFFVRGVAEVSQDATTTARRILELREDHRTLINERFGRAAGNAHRVLESLYKAPIATVKSVQALIASSQPAANSLVAKMASHGILVETTGFKRHRQFRYQPYIDLFGDSTLNAD